MTSLSSEFSIEQLTICALGFRHPSIRWEEIEHYVQDRNRAAEFVYLAKTKNAWLEHGVQLRKRISDLQGSVEEAQKDLERLKNLGAKIAIPGSADYPENLICYPEQPIIISYFGSPFWMQTLPVSIVGSREARSDTLRWMDQELPFVARSGISFISGGARGIDQKAHAVAIRCETPTGVILPSGLEALYPGDLKIWVDDVLASGGAFMSEFAPTQEMRRHHFIQRNRIVAGFSTTTLIAQCGSKSGTWITARNARDNGRSVAVLPGPVWDAQFAGSNDLLFEGADIVRNGEDLVSLILREERQKLIQREVGYVLDPCISEGAVSGEDA